MSGQVKNANTEVMCMWQRHYRVWFIFTSDALFIDTASAAIRNTYCRRHCETEWKKRNCMSAVFRRAHTQCPGDRWAIDVAPVRLEGIGIGAVTAPLYCIRRSQADQVINTSLKFESNWYSGTCKIASPRRTARHRLDGSLVSVKRVLGLCGKQPL